MSVVPEMSDVFRFTELRAPYSPDVKALRQHYIRDDYVDFRGETPCRIDADLQSANSPSAIGKLIFEQVFCNVIEVSNQRAIEGLTEAVLHLLTAQVLPCHDADGRERVTVSLFDLERSAHLKIDDAYYLLPERLEQIQGLPLLQQIERALDVMARASFDFNLKQLISDLETIFDGRTLYEVVYQNGVYTEEFRAVKRALFDTLYLLYVLRRRTSVKLEHVIDGLRVLHVIEALAIDDWFSKLKRKGSSLLPRLVAVVRDFLRRILGSREKVLSTSRGDALFSGLASLFPELVLWNRSDFLPSLPLIQTKADFDAYFKATPIIHPIFARLFQYKQPFNNLLSLIHI